MRCGSSGSRPTEACLCQSPDTSDLSISKPLSISDGDSVRREETGVIHITRHLSARDGRSDLNPPIMIFDSIVGRASQPSVANLTSVTRSTDWTACRGGQAPVIGKESDDCTRTAERKLALLRKSGFFSADTKGCAIERACTLQDLQGAYSLVHDVFVEAGYIRPEPAGIRLRIYEACPETATFVAKKDGAIVGVLSVVLDSREFGLPSDNAFKIELDALRRTGVRLCEVTNQAVAKSYRRSALLSNLMSCAAAYMLETGCHRAIATVSPTHSAFYQLAGFTHFGSERSYSEDVYDPVVAMSVDLTDCQDVPDRSPDAKAYIFNFMTTGSNRFRSCAAEWNWRARSRFLSAELLEGLLVGERNFLWECTPSELQHLRRRWGRKLFDAVWEACLDRFDPRAGFDNEQRGAWARLKEHLLDLELSWYPSPEVAAEET